MKVGWQTRATQTAGDCGVDTMAYFAGLDRTPFAWCDIRIDLADLREAVAADMGWQDCFTARVGNDFVSQDLIL